MSYHLFTGEAHKCKKCDAYFLPFEHDLPCPRCGTRSTEFYDFVPEAVTGLHAHKQDYGHYSPAGFFVGSLPEHIFLLLCNAFDEIEDHSDFRTALRCYLDSSDWGDQAYLSSHIYDIAIRIRERLVG
jgi:hypothetical protein